MSILEFAAQYPDEASAECYFTQHRWPNGVECPECHAKNVARGEQKRRRQLWNCGACKHQFSVTSGTVMHDTKLPLNNWLVGFYAFCVEGMNPRQFSMQIGINYNSANFMRKRILTIVKSGNDLGSVSAMNSLIGRMVGARLTMYKSGDDGVASVYTTASGDQVVKKRRVDVFGASLSVAELAELTGKAPQSIMAQMRGGKTAESAAFGGPPVVTSTYERGSVTNAQVSQAFAEHGTVSRAARALGMNPGTCWSRCNALGLIKPRKIAKRTKGGE